MEEEGLRRPGIRISIGSGAKDFIEIFPDELPVDVDDIEQILKDVVAPLDTWYASAIEYYRQGMVPDFEHIIMEIINALKSDHDIQDTYKKKPDFNSGLLKLLQTSSAEAVNKLRPNAVYDNQKLKSRLDDNFTRTRALWKDDKELIHPYDILLQGVINLKDKDYKKANLTFTSLKTCNEKRLLYAAHLGFACKYFAEKKYTLALDEILLALTANPRCGASVRVALGVCCFELQQFERARLAVERALQMDPCNVDALILLALLERVSAFKNKAKRAEHYTNAYEYCMLAAQMDKSNAIAWNHIAQYLSFTWKKIDDQAALISQDEIQVVVTGECLLAPGDIIRINGSFTANLKELQRTGTIFLIKLNVSIPENILPAEGALRVEAKELNYARKLADRALKCSTVDAVNAESYYILGRLFHMVANYDNALGYYSDALRKWPDFAVASVAIGQIHFARKQYPEARETFEFVISKFPNDRDSLAFLMLLGSMTKSHIFAFEEIKDAVTGFQFEIDVWQLQGYLRHGRSSEYLTALKCYETALAVMNKQGVKASASMLNNMVVLYYATGSISSAISTSKEALNAYLHHATAATARSSKVFLSVENAFLNEQLDHHAHCTAESADTLSIPSAASSLSAGDVLILNDAMYTIASISGDSVQVKGQVELITGDEYTVRQLLPGRLLCEDTLTVCFNYARLLEESGSTAAAAEVYHELLALNPNFLECNMRLGCINRKLARYTEAVEWFNKAAELADDDSLKDDIAICIGETYAGSQQYELAKGCFDKLLKSGRKPNDRLLLLMGNLYFDCLYTAQKVPASNYPDSLKNSYKYYFNILLEDKTNIGAAIGLGMACAEKGELEAAREIFTKIRDIAPENMNATVNLAHVYMYQARYAEAIPLYSVALKAVSSALKGDFLEYLGLAYSKNKQNEEAILSLQRAIHQEPFNIRYAHNLAMVREEYAVSIMNKPIKTASEIQVAVNEFELAKICCEELLKEKNAYCRKAGINPNNVEALLKFCTDNMRAAQVYLEKALEIEESGRLIRQQQDLEHRERVEQMRRQKAEELEAAERQKKELQEKAQEKTRMLQQLQETWSAANATSAAEKEKKPKQKKRKEARSADEEEEAPQDYSDESDADAVKGKLDIYDSDEEPEPAEEGSDKEATKDKVKKSKKIKKQKRSDATVSTAPEIYDSDNEAAPAAEDARQSKSSTGGLLKRTFQQTIDDDEDMEFDTAARPSEQVSAVTKDDGDEAEESMPASKVRRTVIDDDDE